VESIRLIAESKTSYAVTDDEINTEVNEVRNQS